MIGMSWVAGLAFNRWQVSNPSTPCDSLLQSASLNRVSYSGCIPMLSYTHPNIILRTAVQYILIAMSSSTPSSTISSSCFPEKLETCLSKLVTTDFKPETLRIFFQATRSATATPSRPPGHPSTAQTTLGTISTATSIQPRATTMPATTTNPLPVALACEQEVYRSTGSSPLMFARSAKVAPR